MKKSYFPKKKTLVKIMIIYIILFYIKLDKLDRISLYYGIIYNNTNINWSLTSKIECLFNYLITPFMYNSYFEHMNQGEVYNSYLYKYFPNLIHNMNDKLYWFKVFQKNKINTPTVVAFIKKKKIFLLKNIDNHKNYICKPINGAFGSKIFKIKGKDILKSINKLNNVLFQDLLYDCNTNNARSFRYVSLYNGNSFRCSITTNSKSIVSNISHGGKRNNDCKNIITRNFERDCFKLKKQEKIELKKIMNKLSNLHKNSYNKVFSIGWDIVIHCSDSVSYSYCLEGNGCHGTWYIKEAYDIKSTRYINKIIKDYKSKCYEFYKKNNFFKI